MLLDVVETADELLVRQLERIVGVQLVQAGCVDDGEQEVAELLGGTLAVLTLQLSLQLVEFLAHLCPDILLVLPVEAHVAGLVLDTICLDERRQRLRHPRQDGLVAVLLLQLNLFPALQHGLGILGHCIAVDMGVTEYQLVAQTVTNIGNIELLLLLTDFPIEDHVQQHVAQLLADFLLVITNQSVAQLIGLLDGVRTQALVRLLTVPRTLGTQAVHHIEQTAERRHLFISCMHFLVVLQRQSYALFSILPTFWQKLVTFL